MIEYTGAGLMTLICLIIIIGVGTLIYQSRASHPDAGYDIPDVEHWVMRQIEMTTGRVRYVNTKTSDKSIALGMAEAVNFSKNNNWYCTNLILADYLLD